MMEKNLYNTNTKIFILDKISKFILDYAAYKKINYIKLDRLKDSNGIEYKVILIDKEKLFEHTEYFKKYKHKKEFIVSGRKTMNFFIAANEYVEKKYNIYTILENKIKNLLNDIDNFTIKDLEEINILYRKFKIEVEKS